MLRGEEPRPLHAGDGGDCCYAPNAGRAIALLMTTENLRHDTDNLSSGRPVLDLWHGRRCVQGAPSAR